MLIGYVWVLPLIYSLYSYFVVGSSVAGGVLCLAFVGSQVVLGYGSAPEYNEREGIISGIICGLSILSMFAIGPAGFIGLLGYIGAAAIIPRFAFNLGDSIGHRIGNARNRPVQIAVMREVATPAVIAENNLKVIALFDTLNNNLAEAVAPFYCLEAEKKGNFDELQLLAGKDDESKACGLTRKHSLGGELSDSYIAKSLQGSASQSLISDSSEELGATEPTKVLETTKNSTYLRMIKARDAWLHKVPTSAQSSVAAGAAQESAEKEKILPPSRSRAKSYGSVARR